MDIFRSLTSWIIPYFFCQGFSFKPSSSKRIKLLHESTRSDYMVKIFGAFGLFHGILTLPDLYVLSLTCKEISMAVKDTQISSVKNMLLAFKSYLNYDSGLPFYVVKEAITNGYSFLREDGLRLLAGGMPMDLFGGRVLERHKDFDLYAYSSEAASILTTFGNAGCIARITPSTVRRLFEKQ